MAGDHQTTNPGAAGVPDPGRWAWSPGEGMGRMTGKEGKHRNLRSREIRETDNEDPDNARGEGIAEVAMIRRNRSGGRGRVTVESTMT